MLLLNDTQDDGSARLEGRIIQDLGTRRPAASSTPLHAASQAATTRATVIDRSVISTPHSTKLGFFSFWMMERHVTPGHQKDDDNDDDDTLHQPVSLSPRPPPP